MIVKTTDTIYAEYKLSDGKKYRQFPLVASQKIRVMRALTPVLMKMGEIVKPLAPSLVGKKKAEFSSLILEHFDALGSLLQEVTGDILPTVFGVVLMGEADTIETLRQVRDYADRGDKLMSLMPNEEENEVVKDFFTLNRSKFAGLLRAVGINLADLPNETSSDSSNLSSESLNSSPTDGDKIPKS